MAAEKITTRQQDYSQWYLDIVHRGFDGVPRGLRCHRLGSRRERRSPVAKRRAEVIRPFGRARRSVVAAAPGQEGGGE